MGYWFNPVCVVCKSMSKIRKSAKGEDCALRTPYCNNDPETVVLCHAPYAGKFGSRKDDWWAAYGCSACHDVMDGRDRIACANYDYKLYWLDAIHETQAKLIEKGLMEINE